jgi:hypothetical protein
MADLDRLLRSDIAHAAADAVQPPDFTPIERRGVQRRRTHTLLAVAAAVVVLVGVAGSIRILGHEDAAPPTPAEQPPPLLMPAGDAAIEPGTYLVPRSAGVSVDFTVTFPDGWRAHDSGAYDKHADEPDEIGFQSVVVDKIYADACRGDRGAQTKVGPGADDLVSALLEQPGPAKSGPVETTLGGYPATRVDLRVPRRLQSRDCFRGPGTGVQLWLSEPDDYLVLDADGLVSVYVVEVNGERKVFTSQYRPAYTSKEDQAELQQILDSIRIEG